MKWRRLVAIGAGSIFALGAILALLGLEGRRRGSQPQLDRNRIRYGYPELGVTIDDYPKVDGSTSTQPLQMILACKVFGVQTIWSHSESDDTRTLWPNWYTLYVEWPGAAREDPHQVQTRLLYEYLGSLVQPHGTSEAYTNLIKKRADLILVARAPSGDESKRAVAQGVRLDARPVALDAFIFLLNGKNPVASLTIDQLRDIYSGRIVNWRDLGGPDARIRPYQRPRNSGSQELMKRFVMRGRPMIEGPDLLLETLMSSPYLALEKDVHGIGYSVYYYHEFMAPPNDVKACAVAGVLPTSETIRSRGYPFLSEVYVVVRADLPPEHPARRLRDWLLGPQGQEAVEESGYVAMPE
jgi:phosphate transport system substrate-binding protein